MIATLGACIALTLYFMFAPPPRRKNPSRVQAQESHRMLAEEGRRLAAREADTAARHRKQARTFARDLAFYQWGAVFYADTHPTMAGNYERNILRLEKQMVSYANSARISADAAEEHMAQARRHQREVDRLAPRVVRPQPDLLLLVRVCWEGARKARIRRLESSRVSLYL